MGPAFYCLSQSKLLLCRFDGDAQADAFAWIVGSNARVVTATIVVRYLIAGVARFPVIDLAALLYSLLLHATLVIILVIDAVTDHGASDRACRRGGRTAIAAANLATEQGASDTADDRTASAALLWRRLNLHVLGAAFLAWTVDLFHLWHDARDAAEIFKVGGLGEWQSTDTKG